MSLLAALDYALGRLRLMPSLANTACCPVQLTDDFTIQEEHLGTVICCDKATTLSVTIPKNTTLPGAVHPLEVEIFNHGAGDLALIAATDVTILNPYSVANPNYYRLKIRSANLWHVIQTQ